MHKLTPMCRLMAVTQLMPIYALVSTSGIASLKQSMWSITNMMNDSFKSSDLSYDLVAMTFHLPSM